MTKSRWAAHVERREVGERRRDLRREQIGGRGGGVGDGGRCGDGAEMEDGRLVVRWDQGLRSVSMEVEGVEGGVVGVGGEDGGWRGCEGRGSGNSCGEGVRINSVKYGKWRPFRVSKVGEKVETAKRRRKT